MPTLHYQITLKDDVILSSGSTSVEHHTLDYIPGNALLGVLAGKIYTRLSESQAFTLFHSGNVRFNNAYINQALPMPLSWHVPKGEEFTNKKGQIVTRQLFDLSHRSLEAMGKRQPRQLRNHFIDSGFMLHAPLSAYRLKTAIAPASGQAKESQLFGYQHLVSGQHFFGSIGIAPQVDDTLIEHIKTGLQGQFRLGRSRNSQYGRVHFAWREATDSPAKASSDRLTLWCLSDCCVQSPLTGQPVLQILPEYLGLEGKLLQEKTFIRTRRYIPYNAWRGGYEYGREVISQGSVINFQLSKALTGKAMETLEAQGIGLFREQGLGCIALNHTWLLPDYQPIAVTIRTDKKQQVSKLLPPPESRLCQWLERQDGSEVHLQTEAEQILLSLREFYYQGRQFHAVERNQDYGLSNTQWGHLYDIAKNNRSVEDLEMFLFSNPDALCKPEHNEEWSLVRNAQGESFRDWLYTEWQQLQHKVDKHQFNERDASIILTRVAKKARTENEHWLRGRKLLKNPEENNNREVNT